MNGSSADTDHILCAFCKFLIIYPAHSASGIVAFCVVGGQALKKIIKG